MPPRLHTCFLDWIGFSEPNFLNPNWLSKFYINLLINKVVNRGLDLC